MHDHQYSIPNGDKGRIYLDSFGGGDYLIEVGTQTICFEWSDRFGPLPVTKTGKERDLRHNHPFWRAVSLWKFQGGHLEGNKAIWHEPRKPVTKRIGRRFNLIVEQGEPGWDW